MRKFAIPVLLIASATSAAAADLTVSQCMLVSRGLSALDGVGATLEQAPPPGARQYNLGSLRWTVAKNQAQLQPVIDSFQKARGALLREVSGGSDPKPGTPEYDRLIARLQEILDKPCDVALARIPLASLKLGDEAGQNQIPPSVLAALAPIVDP